MSKGKPARIGIYFGGAIGDNAECCEFIGKHSIDFYITDFWNGPNETRFEEVNRNERYLGKTGMVNMLDSLSWSNLVVANMKLHPDLENIDTPLKSIQASDHLQEQLNWAAFLAVPAVQFQLLDESTALASAMTRAMSRGSQEVLYWAIVDLLKKCDSEENEALASWRKWNRFRLQCDQHHRLGCVIRLTENVPVEYGEDYKRWQGEPVKGIIIPKTLFRLNKSGYPVLLKHHQEFILSLAHLDPYMMIECDQHYAEFDDMHLYSAYIAKGLWSKRTMIDSIQDMTMGFEDTLQMPLQPLSDHLESSTYEIFEKDPIKYAKYREAARLAMIDKHQEEGMDSVTVAVVGAGRGPLVYETLKAAEEANIKIKLYAVEKNPSAVYIIQRRNEKEWGGVVEVISSDMRDWRPGQILDIVISELLGSFGDNELSPECLLGAAHLLKNGAISIPQSYTSYAAPISSMTLYNQVRRNVRRNATYLSAFEAPYVVRMHNKYVLSDVEPVFTYTHPKATAPGDNEYRQFKRLQFTVKSDALCHGFAGYFDSVLYKDVKISIHPDTHTEGMFSWYPVYFPIEKGIELSAGAKLSIDIWRCGKDSYRWYEWRVNNSQLYNMNGRGSKIGCCS